MRGIRRSLTVIGLIALAACGHGWAKERLVRRFDSQNVPGLLSINRITQGADGFLWLGTTGGLVRFDGTSIRHWGRDVLTGAIETIAVGPHGEVFVTDHPARALHRVDESSVVPVRDPDGHPIVDVEQPAFAADGSLWFLREGSVVRRDSDGSTIKIGPERFGGDRLFRVHAFPEVGVLATTRSGLWEVTADAAPRPILQGIEGIGDIQPHPDGSLYLLTFLADGGGVVYRYLDGKVEQVWRSEALPIDLVVRNGTVWAAFDYELVLLRPDREPETLDLDAVAGGIGGRMLVDREDSLWIGNQKGLFQLPEPDTVLWTKEDGLPAQSPRYLARSPEGLWLSTWRGLARFAEGRWRILGVAGGSSAEAVTSVSTVRGSSGR